MRKFHHLLLGIACLFYTSSFVYADSKTPKTENVNQTIPALPSKALAADANEEDEFKEQLKEQRRLEIENSLIRVRLERELADLRADIERLRWKKEVQILQVELEQVEQAKLHEKEISALNREKERITAINALTQAKLTQLVDQFNMATAELQNQSALMKVEAEKLRSEIEQTRVKQERKKYIDGEPTYLENPLLKDGTLIISDRSIEMNGVITSWLANYVTDRIDYFNNQDKTKPIFIVIEDSPGGSVAAGSRILRAMHNSQAPVYVVVKSFAASMAALIATLAKQCYAYPNAMILHHQPWTFFIGNIRETKESLAFMQEWWKRLGGKVAEKMGISLDKLDKQLYENSASGDWMEFADHAKKIKWVDHIINGVRDTANRELPDPADYTWRKYIEKYYGQAPAAEHEHPGTIYLPRLAPKDFYYLYNPDQRYQLAK